MVQSDKEPSFDVCVGPTVEEPLNRSAYGQMYGLVSGWGFMARQLEIELSESFDGTKSSDKMITEMSKVNPDETFRL